jgi:hypothetical protein
MVQTLLLLGGGLVHLFQVGLGFYSAQTIKLINMKFIKEVEAFDGVAYTKIDGDAVVVVNPNYTFGRLTSVLRKVIKGGALTIVVLIPTSSEEFDGSMVTRVARTLAADADEIIRVNLVFRSGWRTLGFEVRQIGSFWEFTV